MLISINLNSEPYNVGFISLILIIPRAFLLLNCVPEKHKIPIYTTRCLLGSGKYAGDLRFFTSSIAFYINGLCILFLCPCTLCYSVLQIQESQKWINKVNMIESIPTVSVFRVRKSLNLPTKHAEFSRPKKQIKS